MTQTVSSRLEYYQALPIIRQMLQRLWDELPRELYYHGAAHSEDVLRETVTLSSLDEISDREQLLLAVAAAYHDAGFLKSPLDNERFGAQFAVAAMQADGGFSEQEQETVARMILDTRLQSTSEGLRQIPSTPLSGYLLDADMSNLGRDDFVDKLELLRREFGFERVLFLRRTYDLIQNHRWHTPAAVAARQAKTVENIQLARGLLEREEAASGTGVLLGTERLSFLARLPLLLNCSMSVKDVIERSLDHLRLRLNAEAGTVFLSDPQSQQLTFWALKGGESTKLSGQRMPAGKGVVGWVIANHQSALVNDVAGDKRFFSTIDKEGSFTTRNMLCVPLSVRGESPFGALQVLNREGGRDFTDEDLQFIEQFAAQISLSLDNAMLLEKLQERSRSLEILEKKKNDIITLVAHEFRTPLNVIQNSADLLAHGLSSSEQERLRVGEALTRAVDRLAKLVSQMRNVSLIGSEVLALDCERIEWRSLLKKVSEEFSLICRERNLEVSLAADPEVYSEADQTLMHIAVRNLIANAVRFTADHGKLSISLQSRAGMAVIEIKDTGIGIEAEKIPLLTEKFYEVVDAMYHTSGDYQFGSSGLGLGLSAVSSILKAHGSTLEVESTPGIGSTFRFRIKALP